MTCSQIPNRRNIGLRALICGLMFSVSLPFSVCGLPKVKPMVQSMTDSMLIGRLQTRTRIISILTSNRGPVFTVRNLNGKPVAIRLTKQELLARYPDLEDTITKGLAGNDASLIRFD